MVGHEPILDHVYMASEFTGDSYYIGRIMEFGKPINGKPLQVRIGWFYRPKDVMARRYHDSRQLIATMHSDLNPLASIRGRCVVTHQAYIKDLDAYKKKPNHFYYNQLFDRYIHRFYDVLPVESVRNLPPDVAEELNKRYQYIVVEAGTGSEYTDAHRVCLICKRWCASGEALKCIMCHGFHHMLCINPPMLKKPSKGFAFQCALCTRLAMDSTTSSPNANSSSPSKHSVPANNTSTSSSGQNTPRGSPKQKSQSTLTVYPNESNKGISRQAFSATSTSNSGPREQKMSHMWPFRYFGTHADIQDIFDPDDRVYPRASSRVGAKFQAAVVKWDKPGQILITSTIFDDPSNNGVKGRTKKGGRGGRPSNKLRVPEIADYMKKVRALKLPIASHSADMIDRALLELQKSDFDADKALGEVRLVQKQDFNIRDWTPKEIEAFEEGIRTYGHELFAIKKMVETRSMRDIVRFFYQWKKTDRYQPVYSVFTKVHKPNKKFKSVGRRALTVPATDGTRKLDHHAGHEVPVDQDSLILPTAENASTFECTHCGTTSTTMWRRAPGETDLLNKNPKVYCNDCGSEWVRYVTLPSLVDMTKEPKKSKGKDNTAKFQGTGPSKLQMPSISLASTPPSSDAPVGVKRKRGEPKATTLLPVVPPNIKKVKEQSREPSQSPSPVLEGPCSVCNQHSAVGEQLLSCHECQLAVHRDCYGVASDVPLRHWTCDTCQNTHNPTCSTNYDCVLCIKSSVGAPQALKRTTGNNWAHILCSIWIPEPTFVDVDSLSPIESIGKIRNERWRQSCSICKQKKGACVGCGEGCKKSFHVTCAREAGYEIAFEMQPAKSIKGGVMVPMIWCPNHDLSTRKIIHIRDQPDALTDRNALQTYVHYYKQADSEVASTMRKCRLLMALNPNISAVSVFPGGGVQYVGTLFGPKHRHSQGGQSAKAFSKISAFSNPQECCSRCRATVSPIWWPQPTSVVEQQRVSTVEQHAGLNGDAHSKLDDEQRGLDAKVKDEEEEGKVDAEPSGGKGLLFRDKSSLDAGSSPLYLCHGCFWESRP
ncbi:putative PHD type zinc finger protein with BAH domain-containing protein [Podila humilis]|nr:putative PHD type zinc finger protein with BAH domain-containing protein [Podila humilis]